MLWLLLWPVVLATLAAWSSSGMSVVLVVIVLLLVGVRGSSLLVAMVGMGGVLAFVVVGVMSSASG